jgi:hypothetical protein
MSVSLPNGSTIHIANAYGPSKVISAVSNANPAVATLEASHGVIVGDIIVVKSGWSRVNDRVVRASAVATNDVTLEGINSLNATTYPSGSGIGSAREVTGWTQISQILEMSTSGSEQQFVTYSFLEDDAEHQIPTVKSPMSCKMKIADDITLAHYAVLDAADLARTPQVIRITPPSGGVVYWHAYVTLSRTPTMTKNELMGLEVTLSLVSEVTRYAA